MADDVPDIPYVDNSGTGDSDNPNVAPIPVEPIPGNYDNTPESGTTIYGLQTVPDPMIAPGNMDNGAAG